MPSAPQLDALDRSPSSEIVLSDLYNLIFTDHISLELQQIQTPETLTGGYISLKELGVMNEFQWVVFCSSHLAGGIGNGGVWDGLLGNQPQLVADSVPLLKLLKLESIADRFNEVLAPVLTLQAAAKQSLQKFETFDIEQYWEDLQAAEDQINEENVELLEQDFLGQYGSSEPTIKSAIEEAAVSFAFSDGS